MPYIPNKKFVFSLNKKEAFTVGIPMYIKSGSKIEPPERETPIEINAKKANEMVNKSLVRLNVFFEKKPNVNSQINNNCLLA
jgi:hypothetical protein